MRIVVEISGSLLRNARELAKRERVTFSTLVERGLRQLIAEEHPSEPFKLRRASFKGKGLQPQYHNASFEKLRDLAYELPEID